MNLELMRFSLWPRSDVRATIARLPDGTAITREAWLRLVFTQQIVFDYRGKTFHFVPTLDEVDEPFLVGRIGLLGLVRENEPPEAGLEETLRERWKAIAVLIDPRGHEDGQKVAVEFGTGVAKPLPILSYLVRHINNMKPAPPYKLEVKPVTESGDFWDFVERNEGEVTSVTFEFLVPNMFGIEDDMDREAEELKKNEKAHRAALTIESNDGLELHTDRVKRTVNYTSRGGGEIKATAKHDHFRSSQTVARVRVPEEPVGDDPKPASLRTRLSRAIRYVFSK